MGEQNYIKKSTMGYARCNIKPLQDNTIKLPENWEMHPDIKDGKLVMFDFDYYWAGTTCHIKNIKWEAARNFPNDQTNKNYYRQSAESLPENITINDILFRDDDSESQEYSGPKSVFAKSNKIIIKFGSQIILSPELGDRTSTFHIEEESIGGGSGTTPATPIDPGEEQGGTGTGADTGGVGEITDPTSPIDTQGTDNPPSETRGVSLRNNSNSSFILNTGELSDSIGIQNVDTSYLPCSFKYSYTVRYINNEWQEVTNETGESEYSDVEYLIEIDKIKIPKTSKYEHNVVFTENGVNELLANIQAWPYAKDSTSAIMGGINIPDDDDLNTYNQPGRFYCASYEHARTIDNTPLGEQMSSGFILHVIGNYTEKTLIQIMTTNGKIYYRIHPYNNNDDDWPNWIDLSAASTAGAAEVAEKLGTIDKGSATQPIYLEEGVPTEADPYAGGTNITLNGTPKGGESVNFYAPLVAGTSGYFLQSNGNGLEPTWTTVFPSQSGNSGKFLTTNGTTTSWATVDALPSQTNNNGKFLTTNGTTASWATVSTTDNKVSASKDDTTNTYRSILLASNTLSTSTTTVTDVTANTAKIRTSVCVNTSNGYLYADRVYNAVFNDYAEYRTTIDLTPGHVVIDQDDGSLACSTTRLQPGAQVISDTFGHSMGETDTAKTPLAVAGRVLVYTYQPRENYHAGMAVCSGPDGTVDIMTREEIRDYPDCIVGIVSEIPQYETWGSDNVKVDGRIWIKVK